MNPSALVDHFFRHEYGRLVAILTGRIGVEHIEAIEDAVQQSLMKALECWKVQGVPDNPSAWVYKVARNQIIDDLRRTERQSDILAKSLDQLVPEASQALTEGGKDQMLNMLLVCCHEAIAEPSRIILALKTLCGFSIGEIALRLFVTEDNVYKRLGRARKTLRNQPDLFEPPSAADIPRRIRSVNKILYLLFTEGYLCHDKDYAIREQLCREAIRLALIVAEDHRMEHAETYALLALMYFHVARLASPCGWGRRAAVVGNNKTGQAGSSMKFNGG